VSILPVIYWQQQMSLKFL